MSLFVLLDNLITDNEFKAHCVFYMAVMAFSTVLLNGTSSKWVLQALGLLRMTPQQLQVLRHVLQEVDGVADTTLAEVAPDAVLGPPDAGLVKRWSNVGAAASLSSAHNRVLKHLDTLPSSGRSGSHPGELGGGAATRPVWSYTCAACARACLSPAMPHAAPRIVLNDHCRP